MLLLASSVCGLFKWRQLEAEVILLAVGWYLRFSLSYRDVEELLAERGLHRSRHGVAMGTALRSGNGTTFALEAQTDQQQLAGGRDLHPGEREVALPLPGGGFHRRHPRLPSLGQAGHGRGQALSLQSARQSKPSDAASRQHRQACRL